jgi:hypothetical protein
MSDLIPVVKDAKFLWDLSKPVRSWLWSKLPSARDAKRREIAENLLADVLEDANKLARSLSPDDADAAIDKRIEQFKADLLKAKIPVEDAETLVERGSLFVKLLVTGPMGETAALRERVAEMERAGQETERLIVQFETKAPWKDQLHRLELQIHRMHTQIVIAWSVAGVAAVLGLVGVLLAMRGQK